MEASGWDKSATTLGASILKYRYALAVISLRINSINTDGVSVELLEDRNFVLTALDILVMWRYNAEQKQLPIQRIFSSLPIREKSVTSKIRLCLDLLSGA